MALYRALDLPLLEWSIEEDSLKNRVPLVSTVESSLSLELVITQFVVLGRAFEVFREPQRHSPTSVQEGTVLATPLRADPENHVIDPRRVRSRIPRYTHFSTMV